MGESWWGPGRGWNDDNDFSSIKEFVPHTSHSCWARRESRVDEKCTWMWLSICGMWAWLHYPPASSTRRDFGIFWVLVYCSILCHFFRVLKFSSLTAKLCSGGYFGMTLCGCEWFFREFLPISSAVCGGMKNHHTTHIMRGEEKGGKGRKYFSSVA